MNLIRKFILFLFITSIIPIFTLWFFLLKETNDKLDERFSNLANTATMLVAEHLQNDLEKLELANNQAVLLTISDKYKQFTKNDESESLADALNKLQESRNLGIVALIDSKLDIVASTDTFEDASKDSLNQLIKASLNGSKVKSIEKLKINLDSSETLMYLSVAPLFRNKGKQEIIGALLIGQSIEENNSFDKITKILLNTKIEVSTEKSKATRFLPLKSYLGNTVGFLSIHISRVSEENLKLRNTILMIICLILIIVTITVFALRFNQNFVKPMNQIADACNKLSRGDLNATIDTSQVKGEVRNTVLSFNKMAKQLLDDEKMRSNFISTLSHDLQTPLIAQRRAIDLIQEFQANIDNEFLKLLKGLSLNNEHLLNMVRLLLENYKYDPSKIIIEKKACKIFKLVDEAQSSLKPLIDAKQVKFINKIPKDCELEVDSRQFRRVITNLVGNAIDNIQDNGAIQFSSSETDKEIIIKVSDDGYGIDPEVLPFIFERYFTRSKSKQKIGSGLGLFICKTIVEAHKGKIHVESTLDSGTSFYIHLSKGTQI
ncbi:MAG: HAMP domain-containing sensor histidine kinase [Candidatus Caenarcaniphilales bacterium]|nr:HAMP domain-containing sensor histidine kinase [Candidatus Caenarcaniphilales bacterium]